MAETKTISIHKQDVEVTAPYAEGHTINANEARVLNQVRAENIANNFRSKIKAALDGEEGAEPLPTVLAALADYDKTYEFSAASSGGSRATLSPVDKEARRLARKYITRKLAEEGRKVKDIDKEKLESEIVRISESEAIQKIAKDAVKKQDSLEGLDI